MADWARTVNTTISDYIRGEEVNVMRNRKILALLQDRGRVTFNHGGQQLDWKVRYRRAPMAGFSDSDTLSFSRQNRHKTAQLDWRGYSATDQMTGFEKEKNKGDAAIIKVFSNMGVMLMEDIEDQFGDEAYIDGNASGNGKRYHGIESFFSVSAASTKQPVGLPNDTYAGLLTTLGNYGGAWTTTGSTTTATDWPTGTGDAHYDFWSPLVVDYTSAISTSASNGTTGWAASTKTWPNTCLEAIRYGIIHSRKNKSKKGQLDVGTFQDEMYRQFLDKLQAEEQLTVSRGDSGSDLYRLGFKDVVNFDGLDITTEYGLPTKVGYGWCIDQLELMSMLDVLFKAKGPDYDLASDAYRFAIFIMGNYKYRSVRQFVKWKNVS